ncbi:MULTISPECIES: HU family DNA-binding protein [Lactobacillus]
MLRKRFLKMASVNKAELVKEIAEKTEMKKKDAEAVLESVISTIQDELVKGNKVQLIGFGTFEVRHRAARKGRNPQTGKEITIPATQVPAFKPGKALKESVNK